MVDGGEELAGFDGIQKPMAVLSFTCSLDFRRKKRRPWTSLDVKVVGRGNLNWKDKLLFFIDLMFFVF